MTKTKLIEQYKDSKFIKHLPLLTLGIYQIADHQVFGATISNGKKFYFLRDIEDNIFELHGVKYHLDQFIDCDCCEGCNLCSEGGV
jgi:membrane protease subunit (stomatin/prohibitin family)